MVDRGHEVLGRQVVPLGKAKVAGLDRTEEGAHEIAVHAAMKNARQERAAQALTAFEVVVRHGAGRTEIGVIQHGNVGRNAPMGKNVHAGPCERAVDGEDERRIGMLMLDERIDAGGHVAVADGTPCGAEAVFIARRTDGSGVGVLEGQVILMVAHKPDDLMAQLLERFGKAEHGILHRRARKEHAVDHQQLHVYLLTVRWATARRAWESCGRRPAGSTSDAPRW